MPLPWGWVATRCRFQHVFSTVSSLRSTPQIGSLLLVTVPWWLPSGDQTWQAGKSTRIGGFKRKITGLNSISSIAMFDYRRGKKAPLKKTPHAGPSVMRSSSESSFSGSKKPMNMCPNGPHVLTKLCIASCTPCDLSIPIFVAQSIYPFLLVFLQEFRGEVLASATAPRWQSPNGCG